MWRQPDSAFLRLQEFADHPEADSLSEFDGHYFHLLLSELLYKNDYSQTNRVELLQAVDYLDSVVEFGNISFLDARAHYIKGVGYYEMDSVVEACGEYLKALEVMKEHFQEKDLVGKKAQFLSLTHNRLGDLFSGQFMMEPSIVCYEQALHYCLIEPTTLQGLSRTLYFIGKQYDKMDDYDRARRYYDQAVEELKSTDNCLYRDIVSSKALCDYLSGFDSIRPFENLRQVLLQANDEGERLSRFLTIGTLFLEKKMYDSAVYYLEPVFECSEDTLSRIQAAECLHHAYMMTNDEDKAGKYVRFLATHATESYNNAVTTSKLEKAFQSFTDNEQRKKAAQERKASVLKTLSIVVPTGLALAALLLIALKRRNRKALEWKESLHREEIDRRHAESDTMLREKDLRFEEEKKAWEEQTTVLRNEIGLLNAEVKRREEVLSEIATRREEKLQDDLRIKEEQLLRLRGEIDQLNEELERRQEAMSEMQARREEKKQKTRDAGEEKARRKAFLEEPVCKKITKSLQGIHITARNTLELYVSFTNADAAALRDAVSRHYCNFDTSLRSQNPKMSDNDLLLCHLLLLGLNEKQVSVLMCKSYSTIKKHINKLEKALKIRKKLADYILKTTGF